MTDDSVTKAAPPGFAARIDAGIFRVEQILVTFAALVMTTTVSLDIVHRAFVSEESGAIAKLAELGAQPGLLIVLFMLGWGIYAAALRHRDLPRPASRCAMAAVFSVIVGVLFIAFVTVVPSEELPERSRWAFVAIAVGATGIFGWKLRSAGTASMGLLMAYLVATLWVTLTFEPDPGYVIERSAWVCASLLFFGIGGAMAHRLSLGELSVALFLGAFGVLGAWGCMLLRENFIWSQELSLILLAWLAFLGGSMATREKKHIIVDALSKLVPASLSPWARVLGLLVTTAFCGYIAALAFFHVFGDLGDFTSGERRPSTGIPAWTITLSMVVAFGLMTLRFGAETIDAFLKPSLPERRLDH
jgi:TRAP-type C4-dicarboxylate transport system permease small subunit